MKKQDQKVNEKFQILIDNHDKEREEIHFFNFLPYKLDILPEKTITFTFFCKKSKPRKKTKQQLERNRINDHIDKIMVEHGPDGHTDGSGIITNYILHLLRTERRKKT